MLPTWNPLPALTEALDTFSPTNPVTSISPIFFSSLPSESPVSGSISSSPLE